MGMDPDGGEDEVRHPGQIQGAFCTLQVGPDGEDRLEARFFCPADHVSPVGIKLLHFQVAMGVYQCRQDGTGRRKTFDGPVFVLC